MNGSIFSSRLCASMAGLVLAGGVHALPQGGDIVAGTARMARSGTALTITQTSPTLLIDWRQFDIAARETVTLHQPSREALALIRIDDAAPSQVQGRLQANGQVWLINRQGLVFAAGSRVSAGGFLASTLTTPTSARADLPRRFSGTGEGAVVNAGRIEAAAGGYATLLGHAVSNAGELVSPQGSAAVVAGSEAMLTFHGVELTDLQLAAGKQHHRAENSGLLQADGGRVLLMAGTDDSAVASEVINTGRLQARTLKQEGRIAVLAGMRAGHARIDGVLDASASAGGHGGRIDTNAARLQLADSVRVTTAGGAQYGTWVIDPQDYTVAASGGDISGAALSANLATTNVTIESSAGNTAGSGNVNINDTVSWSANTTLTLTAANNVNINANLTATGATAGLVLNPNTTNGKDSMSNSGSFALKQGVSVTLSGATPTFIVAGVGYTVINALGSAADATTAPATPTLQGMAALNNLSTNYALGSDIDASVTSTWNGGAGFTPAGNGQGFNPSHNPFRGNLEGLGHTIRNLTINRPTTSSVGLFGFTYGNIGNVGLEGGSVVGNAMVGMLAGAGQGIIVNSYATGNVTETGGGQAGGLSGSWGPGTVSTSYATGNVSGSYYVGGLVGASGTISNSYATGNVTASDKYAGGLVGMQQGAVSGSYATGAVSGPQGIGGLVGYNASSISTSYATGAVSGNGPYMGGLAGVSTSTIDSSYASGTVTGGTDSVGGLVGQNAAGTISNSYALGRVSSSACRVGGLVGQNRAGTVITSYTASAVSGSSAAQCTGGLVGSNNGSVTSAYWNTSPNGALQAFGYNYQSSGVAGLSAGQMRSAANFAGFTFTTTTGATGNNWVIVDVDGSLNNAGNAAGATLPMLATEYGTVIGNAHQLQLVALAPAAQYQLRRDVDASATGAGGDVWSSAGFVPLANFAGLFDGAGRRVVNLTIKSAQLANIGLFGSTTSSAVVQNLRLANVLVASANANGVGGLVGSHNGGIQNSCVSGSVTGSRWVGGLVGSSKGGISRSCALGSVKGDDFVGGLVGVQSGGIDQSYAAATVTGSHRTGGLVGYHSTNTDIGNSYATGSVNGGDTSGGLVGANDGRISRNYSTGAVQGFMNTGGLVGTGASFPVTNSFWNVTTSARSSSTGGRGMNTHNMQTPANFTSATPANGNVNPGWDFVNVWTMPAGSYPQLLRVSPAP